MTYLQRGIAYKGKGNSGQSASDLNKAIEIFSKKIENSPRDCMAYNNRGLAYQNKGNLEQAIADYNKSIDIYPNSNAYVNRAEAYFSKQEYDKSWEDIHKAESLGFGAMPSPLDELKNKLKETSGGISPTPK